MPTLKTKLAPMSHQKHIAVLGSGYWGKNLVRNFHALGALHTVCDTDETVLGALLQNYPDVKSAREAADVMADPAIVAVAIATPAATHDQLVSDALVAGKDVYVEKPLCLSTARGQKLVTLANAETVSSWWSSHVVSPNYS